MSFLFLSLAGEQQLACYRVDGETGDLEHLRNQPVPGAPSVQGRHCRLPVLYAAMRSNGRLLSFRIDAASGRLAHLHTIDTGLEDPGYLLTDRSGGWLLTPYYVSGKVTVYPVGEDGAAREPLPASSTPTCTPTDWRSIRRTGSSSSPTPARATRSFSCGSPAGGSRRTTLPRRRQERISGRGTSTSTRTGAGSTPATSRATASPSTASTRAAAP